MPWGFVGTSKSGQIQHKEGGAGSKREKREPDVAVVDCVTIDKSDRALIRGLINDIANPAIGIGDTTSTNVPHGLSAEVSGNSTGASGGIDGSTTDTDIASVNGGDAEGGISGLKPRHHASNAKLVAALLGMGFFQQDLDHAAAVCGGLHTMEGSLNWLLLHVPEERIPSKLGSTTEQRGGKPNTPKVKAVRKDTTKMSEAEKTAYALHAMGFAYEDCKWCVQHAFKGRAFTESLKMLLETNDIQWHYRYIDLDAEVSSAAIKAKVDAEFKDLQRWEQNSS